ncbi:hypothetical protein F6A08_13760 [Microbacterium algeriense]|uniref:Uncharacterized protein n=1 Tax=Microbacterium algeriense TaxID=2615184 RepID=A0ABQ6V6W1_9MICO|nr:hypothetical protein F6A08_13760 [Microbacterium algeriense]
MAPPPVGGSAYSRDVSEETTSAPTDGLWSRLRLIEGQPLTARAEAYSALHDELSRRLESGAKLDQRETPGSR